MSKMSNLKKGVIGVCAATMLTGLCAVPAFALGDNSGDTSVTVKTDDLQYNVTMPATSLAGSLSGKDGALTLGTLTIKNESVFSVQLKSVAVSGTEGITLKSESEYATAAGKDIAKAQLTINGQNIDLATLATTPALTTPVYLDTAAEETITLTGAMKSLSASKISDTPFSFAKLTWTIAPGDAPTA